MTLVDAHAHLDDDRFAGDVEEVISRAIDVGVEAIVTAGTDYRTSQAAVELAERFEIVWAAVGIHPNETVHAESWHVDEIRRLSSHPKVVAIGEIGLDYYRDHSPKPVQHRFFELQLRLAKEIGLPVCIHARDAYADVLRFIEDAGKSPGDLGGMLHCFAGTLADARRALDLGFQISIGGPVTYPNAGALSAVVRELPLDRLLTETDCPYLAPQSYRGKRNEPARVVEVAARIAELTGCAVDSVQEATANNARSLFRYGTPGESLK